MNLEVEVPPWVWDKYAAGRMTAFFDTAGMDVRNPQRGDAITLTKRRGVDRLRYVVTHVERIGYRLPVAGGHVDAWAGAVLHLGPAGSEGEVDDA